MADDIFTYIIDMPCTVHEMIMPCQCGYCIYLNARLNDTERRKAYRHALDHIRRGDWDVDNTKSVQQIEWEAHYGPRN